MIIFLGGFLMKIRVATKNRKDFLAFDELYFRTDYSYEIGSISPKLEHPILDTPYNYSEYCEAVVQNHYLGDYCVLFEDDRQNIIGFSIIDNYKPTLEISEFVIKRKYQLQGYGKEFYKLIEQNAKEHEINQIVLYSFFAGSVQFWIKMGFSHKDRYFYKEIQ